MSTYIPTPNDINTALGAALKIDKATNQVAGAIVGPIWTYLTGTIDPFTKQVLVADEIESNMDAGAVDILTTSDQSQADVTATLKLNNADPSQAFKGLGDSADKLISIIHDLTIALLIFGGVVVAVELYGEYKKVAE
jgi:hypothetical protein